MRTRNSPAANESVAGADVRPRSVPGRRRAVLALLAAAALVTACAGAPPPPEKTLVSVSIRATADLNPTADGRPSPLLLRVYQLRDAATFNSAGFFPLYEQDDATLGAELAGREELVVQPGQAITLDLGEVAAGTRYIALFAAYRNLEQALWRKSVDIPRGETTTLLVTLGANGLAVRPGTATAAAGAPAQEEAGWSLSESWKKVLESLTAGE